MVGFAGESQGNGIQDNVTKEVRPQRNEEHTNERTDEQPDDAVVIRVKVKHQDCCVSTASLSTPNTATRRPQDQVQRVGMI